MFLENIVLKQANSHEHDRMPPKAAAKKAAGANARERSPGGSIFSGLSDDSKPRPKKGAAAAK